ncbi:Uncharacterised protein [Vibrio cholerae]|nr:Uncharacterised protein [Vibrio cholerae]
MLASRRRQCCREFLIELEFLSTRQHQDPSYRPVQPTDLDVFRNGLPNLGSWRNRAHAASNQSLAVSCP